MLRVFSDVDPTDLAPKFTRPSFQSISSFADAQAMITEIFGEEVIGECRGLRVYEVFDQAWKKLRSSYRNEYVYKTEIANRIVFGRHSPNTAALHLELPVSGSIADMAIYNGTSTVYEIKTDFDSSARLQSQSDSYLKAFGKVYVVVSSEAASKYLSCVPQEVGVISLSKRGSLSEVKSASVDFKRLDKEVMFRCLRRPEQVEIAEEVLGEKIDLPNGLVYKKCFCVFNGLDVDVAHRLYVEKMRKRKTDKKTQAFVSSLPYSLKALGYATPLSEKKRSIIIRFLNQAVL